MPIFKLNYKLLLTNQIQNVDHQLLTFPPNYTLPGLLLQPPNIFCNDGFHLCFRLSLLRLLHLLHNYDNR